MAGYMRGSLDIMRVRAEREWIRAAFPIQLHELAVAILLLLAYFLPAAASSSGDIDYSRIEHAIEQRDFRAAQRELERRLESDPQDSRAHMLLGIVYDEENEPKSATAQFRISIRLRPKDPTPHVNLGKSNAFHGDLKGAAAEFRTALALDPRNTTARENLGLLFLGERKYDEALAVFQKVVALDPGDVVSWANLFKTQLALKKIPEARASAKRVIELSPASSDLPGELGAMQAAAGDYTGAIESLEKARASKSPSYNALYDLGLAYFKAGRLNSAITTLESLRHDRAVAEVEDLLGEVYEENRQFLDAVKCYQRAAELEPGNRDYRFDFLYELMKHHSFGAATPVAESAVRDFPDSLRFHLALAGSYFGQGRFTDSTVAYLETARKFREAELPLYLLAIASETTGQKTEETMALVSAYGKSHSEQFWPYYYLGKEALRTAVKSGGTDGLPRAEELLKMSIVRNPSHAESHYTLGNLFVRLQRWAEAIEEYQTATKLKPDLTEAHYHLCQAYRRTGHLKEAEYEAEVTDRLNQFEAQKVREGAQVDVFIYKLRE